MIVATSASRPEVASGAVWLATGGFAGTALLAAYVAALRRGDALPQPLFWAALCVAFAFLILQLVEVSRDRAPSWSAPLLLGQALLLAFVLRLLFISTGHALLGYDAYNELVTLRRFQSTSWSPNELPEYSGPFPLLYGLATVWAAALGVDPFATAKWLPVSIFAAAPLLVAALAAELYGKRAGVWAGVLFAFLYIALVFHTILHREALALPLFAATLLAFHCAGVSVQDRWAWRLLTMFLAGLVVLTHHLTSAFLLLFFAFHAAVDLGLGSSDWRGLLAPSRVDAFRRAMPLVYVAGLVAYWTFLRLSPLRSFLLLFAGVTSVGLRLPRLPRYTLLLWGEIIFALLFAGLATVTLYLLRRERRPIDLAMYAFAGLVGLGMALTLTGRLFSGEGIGLGARFETFVYLGLFVLASLAIVDLVRRPRWRIPVLAVVMLFVVMNVYRVPPYLYTEEPPAEGEPRGLLHPGEVHATAWLGLRQDDNVVYDVTLVAGFLEGKLHRGPDEKPTPGTRGVPDAPFRYVVRSSLAANATVDVAAMDAPRIYDNGIATVHIERR